MQYKNTKMQYKNAMEKGHLPPQWPRCPGESKVQVLLELFRRTLLKYYVPGRDLPDDEATAAYFGRYSPMKHIQPHKPSDGLRVYAVCEAASAYLSNFYWDCRTGETIEQIHQGRLLSIK